MNRLVKAEIFRFKKSLPFWILLSLALAVIPLFSCLDILGEKLNVQLESISMTVFISVMVIPAIIAYISGRIYGKGRIGYYEIMAGNPIRNIILSKVFVEGSIFSVTCMLSLSLYYIIIGIVNGLGTIDMPFARLGLFFVVVMRICICSVLIMMAVRSSSFGAGIAYLRFMLFDSAIVPGIMYLVNEAGLEKLYEHLQYSIVLNQLMMSAMAQINKTIVCHIIIGFAAEFILWYLIVYYGMKKKKYR